MHTPEPSGATHTGSRPAERGLDRRHLLDAIADRQARLVELEDELVEACETAALRAMPPTIRRDDRSTWDRATWDRYLACAAALEPEFGPALRRLYREVNQLERLAALPLAA